MNSELVSLQVIFGDSYLSVNGFILSGKEKCMVYKRATVSKTTPQTD